MQTISSSCRAKVLLIGDFPPPITGAAKNNQIVAELFDSKFDVSKLDASSNSYSLNRRFGYHVIRIIRNLRAAWMILCARLLSTVRCIVYHVPNAGFGSVYTLGFVLVCFCLHLRCILHHRSFRYIDCPTLSMRLIQRLMRSDGLHIFLSDEMKQRFISRYGDAVESIIISNAAYMDVTAGHQRHVKDFLVIGHMSNLCLEKGVFDVIETFRRLRTLRDDIHLIIGGPAMNRNVESELVKLVQECGDAVNITGPIQPAEKEQFFEQIDLFLFPTRYAVEAQPNVIFEALASGCPVAAFDRGCIAEMIGPESLLVASNEDFIQHVSNWIVEILKRNQLSERSASALARCDLERKAGIMQVTQFMETIANAS